MEKQEYRLLQELREKLSKANMIIEELKKLKVEIEFKPIIYSKGVIEILSAKKILEYI